ncbi:MAG: FecR domain-containing protein [Pseudomonadales bacterium]|jgi:hypothetical protein|nr:FecR domain-containing protein [Pseudomonadales bacterium]
MRTTIKRIAQGFLLAGLCQGAPLWAVEAAPANAAVGQATLVIGKATLLHADGRREAMTSGMALVSGDQVETQSNAHVHIRFIDQALVSVRPLSRLEIQRYDYRADDPAASAVKFNLVEGVARAISGDAAKSARQNFRMNTPVAAIGVRGTDFVVSADPRQARALVNEGSIVVAPFSSTCLAEALGPCLDSAVELAGGDRQVALVSAGAAEPTLVTVNGGSVTENFLAGEAAERRLDQSGNGASLELAAISHEEENNDDLYAESVSSLVVNDLQVTSQLPEDPPLTSSAEQLVWGRWSDTLNTSASIAAEPYQNAATGRVLVAQNEEYGLYRATGASSLSPELGVLAFDLQQSQVTYTTSSDGLQSPVSVLGALLSIDFSQGSYSTRLDLNEALLGNMSFSSQGLVSADGLFGASDNFQSMSGAVSLDGQQAGYLFEKSYRNGLLDGITLWGRAP